MSVLTYALLFALGILIGGFGTLIGAGGGFLLMPILLLMYPDESPELLTSISLAVVFFNAFSGSLAYARMRRIDYKSGILFSTATIPGAILGVITTQYVPRRQFDALFGFLLIAASVFLLSRKKKEQQSNDVNSKRNFARTLVDADGISHAFSYSPMLGVTISLFVGYVSSLLGIGGGIIHVPALVHFLNFPVHIATATSHFILAVMALTGTIAHIITGSFSQGVGPTFSLAGGVLIGAQVGARLSTRVRGIWIIRGLAIALGSVGVRILFKALI